MKTYLITFVIVVVAVIVAGKVQKAIDKKGV